MRKTSATGLPADRRFTWSIIQGMHWGVSGDGVGWGGDGEGVNAAINGILRQAAVPAPRARHAPAAARRGLGRAERPSPRPARPGRTLVYCMDWKSRIAPNTTDSGMLASRQPATSAGTTASGGRPRYASETQPMRAAAIGRLAREGSAMRFTSVTATRKPMGSRHTTTAAAGPLRRGQRAAGAAGRWAAGRARGVARRGARRCALRAAAPRPRGPAAARRG
jgi:hypothetical protein